VSNARRWGILGGVAALGAVLVATATAWACIAGPTLNLNPSTVKPGQEVTLSGFSYNSERPIVVRFNALDGPILGTFDPAPGRFGDNEFLVGKVTIPANTKPGSYVLIATQSAPDGSLAQVPVRALVTVTADGSVPAVGAPAGQPELGRPVGPVRTESSVTTLSLLLVALGAATVAMLVVGVAVVAAGRRPRPQAAPARR